MPIHEDDVPKLAEIARTLSDFRNEFREAVSKMVRADVYLADLRTIEVRLAALVQENQRLDTVHKQEVARLNEQLKEERNDRRTLRNITLTALCWPPPPPPNPPPPPVRG